MKLEKATLTNRSTGLENIKMNEQFNIDTARQYDRDRIKLRLKDFYTFTSRSFYTNLYENPTSIYNVPTFDDDLSQSDAGNIEDWENMEGDYSDGDRMFDTSMPQEEEGGQSQEILRPKNNKLSRDDDMLPDLLLLALSPDSSSEPSNSYTMSQSNKQHFSSNNKRKEEESKRTAEISFSTLVSEDEWSVHTSKTGYHSYHTTTSSITELRMKKRSYETRFGRL